MSKYKLPIIDIKKTGKNIEKLRRTNGLKVSDLEEAFGYTVSYQAIYKWQRGESLPSIENLVALASMFQCNVEQILIYE